MEKYIYLRKLILSITATAALIYLMQKTTSSKIIFVPFIICGASMAGLCVAHFLKDENLASMLRKIFAAGFLLFWFGFLIFAGYICIRDKNYGLLAYSSIFWAAGIYFFKKRLMK